MAQILSLFAKAECEKSRKLLDDRMAGDINYMSPGQTRLIEEIMDRVYVQQGTGQMFPVVK